jgi:hypothetical protein
MRPSVSVPTETNALGDQRTPHRDGVIVVTHRGPFKRKWLVGMGKTKPVRLGLGWDKQHRSHKRGERGDMEQFH